MLGGLYGDLAADTYLRDKKAFYRELFDEQATLSQYGREILAQAAVLGDEESTDIRFPIRDDVRAVRMSSRLSVEAE